MFTLFLGFAKRRAELAQMGGNKQRQVLEHYSLPLLDMFTAITASAAIITYSLYTVAPETVALHHTDNLVYTVPLVLYAIFRYIFILHAAMAKIQQQISFATHTFLVPCWHGVCSPWDCSHETRPPVGTGVGDGICCRGLP